MITLFNNVLIMCHTEEDGLEKLQKVLERCKEKRVVLKFAKTWIGMKKVNFFGYEVEAGSYKMDDERKQSVMEAKMPTSVKSM